MDIQAWKKRAMELEKIANKLTRENKSLRKQVAFSQREEKKTKKSKVWKRSQIPAGGGRKTATSTEGNE